LKARWGEISKLKTREELDAALKEAKEAERAAGRREEPLEVPPFDPPSFATVDESRKTADVDSHEALHRRTVGAIIDVLART
jgi:hypothetical protein